MGSSTQDATCAISAWWSGFVNEGILCSEGAYAGYRQPSQAPLKLRVRVLARPYLVLHPVDLFRLLLLWIA
jgi:hypothetical protein